MIGATTKARTATMIQKSACSVMAWLIAADRA
jgi:hypothetical protein